MPVELERELQKEAREKFPIPPNATPEQRKKIQDRRDRYVYGTLRKTGWEPGK